MSETAAAAAIVFAGNPSQALTTVPPQTSANGNTSAAPTAAVAEVTADGKKEPYAWLNENPAVTELFNSIVNRESLGFEDGSFNIEANWNEIRKAFEFSAEHAFGEKPADMKRAQGCIDVLFALAFLDDHKALHTSAYRWGSQATEWRTDVYCRYGEQIALECNNVRPLVPETFVAGGGMDGVPVLFRSNDLGDFGDRSLEDWMYFIYTTMVRYVGEDGIEVDGNGFCW